MAETCGFPLEVLEDARALRKVTRESFPLLFSSPLDSLEGSAASSQSSAIANEENSLRSLANLLQHLLLLKDSTTGERYC